MNLLGIILSKEYWIALILSLSLFVSLGLYTAWLILPKPLKYHRTTFFEFSLPKNWTCNKEGSETVCSLQHKNNQAIIIFGAKLRNQQDSLQDYYDYLSTQKKWTTPEGEKIISVVEFVNNKTIKNHKWIDSLHFQSEVPGYYTRYLATITAQLGVLITFSYHRQASDTITQGFEESIDKLRIFQNFYY